MNKLLILLVFTFLTLVAFPKLAWADSGCNPSTYGQTTYGGECPSPNLNIEKFVKNPSTGQFVENLEASNPHFLADQKIIFRLKITNNSNSELTNIEIKDKFPDFTDFISGPGKFDQNTKTLTFSIDKLKPGEFREYEITGKIKPKSALSSNDLSCVTNYSEAKSGGQFSSDTSVYCIENQILAPVQELPKTGPASAILVLLGSSALLATSAFLYKKARV